jgi:hypothetical protein
VKRLLLITTLATIGGGALSASAVIDCSGTAAAINSCVSGHLPNFQTQLDWAVFGLTPNGTIYNGVFTTNNVLPSGLDVSLTSQGGSGPDEGLRAAYNLGEVFFGGEWTLTSLIPAAGYTHPGHFNQTSNPAATLAAIQADPTIHLMGLALNGVSANRQIVLDFNSGFDDLGFYAAAKGSANFTFRVQVFAGSGGTGAVLADQTFTYTGPGGTCASMLQVPSPPVGCNNAPFIYAQAFGNAAHSVFLSSNDADGFYLTNLMIGDSLVSIPEPGPMVLCGLGIALLAFGSRKFRRNTN